MTLRIGVLTGVRALALWDFAPYNPVDRWRRSGGTWCFEDGGSRFVRFCQTTRRHVPGDSSLHIVSVKCRLQGRMEGSLWHHLQGSPRTVIYTALEVESTRFLRNVVNCIPVCMVLRPGSLQFYVTVVVRISSSRMNLMACICGSLPPWPTYATLVCGFDVRALVQSRIMIGFPIHSGGKPLKWLFLEKKMTPTSWT